MAWLAALTDVPANPPAVMTLDSRGLAAQITRGATASRLYLQRPLTDTLEDWPGERIWSETGVPRLAFIEPGSSAEFGLEVRNRIADRGLDDRLLQRLGFRIDSFGEGYEVGAFTDQRGRCVCAPIRRQVDRHQRPRGVAEPFGEIAAVEQGFAVRRPGKQIDLGRR